MIAVMDPSSFFRELKRRNVYKVAVAYAVVGWLVMQVAATVVPALHLPDGITTAVVVLTLLGFPIALVLAWAFEMTPEGMKRTENVPPNEYIPQWSRRKFAAFIFLVVICAAALLGYQLFRKKSAPENASAAPAVSSKSIAVLPLLNESGDPKDDYFSDGLSEELIAALAQIRELKIIGRSSSFRFKERKEESKTIGEKLGVATLLEGTVRKQGDQVRIVAELINAADGIELWTRTFDRELKDIFAVQQEIANAVASALKVRLLGSDERSAGTAATKNPEAHNAYLLGHYHLQRRSLDDYRQAITHFDEAIRLDPEYALAYAERAETWTLIADVTYHDPGWPNAKRDAEKAVALAPQLTEAHAALGWVRFFAEWRFPEGLRELRRAKELSPTNPLVNDLLARVIVYVGRPSEAERQAREATELDPLSFGPLNNLARVLWYVGKADEADAVARKAVALQPTAASSRRWQVLAAVQRGDGDTALREAQHEPDDSYRRFLLPLGYYIRGDRKEADATLAELLANRQGLDYQIAQVYAVRGDIDKAFEWLQISFDSRDTGMLALLVDPLLRNLRDDPRYKSLVAKMNFPPGG